MIVYYNGQFLDKDSVRISPDDRGFLFADGVYEVVRAYQGRLFESEAHLRRLFRSLREIQIEPSVVEGLEDVASELLERNGLLHSDAVVYQQITRGAAPRRHPFPPEGTDPTVYAMAYPLPRPVDKWQTGASVILVPDTRWHRCDIKSTALLPNVLANQAARSAGADEAVFVRDGVVTEGSLSNVAAVFDGTVYTHPLTNHVLGGITRQVALRLCETLDIPVVPYPVLEHELSDADELFLTATTLEIMPVVRFDDRPVAGGRPGPVAKRLHRAFEQLLQQP